jgi:hypothetical protein
LKDLRATNYQSMVTNHYALYWSSLTKAARVTIHSFNMCTNFRIKLGLRHPIGWRGDKAGLDLQTPMAMLVTISTPAGAGGDAPWVLAQLGIVMHSAILTAR